MYGQNWKDKTALERLDAAMPHPLPGERESKPTAAFPKTGMGFAKRRGLPTDRLNELQRKKPPVTLPKFSWDK